MDATTKSSSSGVSAVVEYNYTAKESDELDLVKGAVIHNIKQMQGGWWEGTLQSTGKTGMFPDNFVRLVDANDENAVLLRDKSAIKNRHCKVIYSYTQVNDDELSLGVGDVIEFLGEVEEGWWRGRLRSKVGVFPSNFVVAIEPSPIFASKRPPLLANVSPPTISGASKTTAAAGVNTTFTHAAAASTHTSTSTSNNISSGVLSSLPAKKANRLSFHGSKEDLLGSANNIKITATSAASAMVDEVAPSLPPKPQREFCRVEFPYMPQNEDELYLRVGDIITVISMELPDKGWWKGELRGKVGVFPDNFVKLLPPEVSPLNDAHLTNKASSKHSNVASDAAPAASVATTAASTTTKTNSSTSKVFAKKSGSTVASNQSALAQPSSRKESFGSRDSLNDILSETGLQSGNVAAARKSLENKNIELLHAPDAANRVAMKKAAQQQQQDIGNTTQLQAHNAGTSSSELRKSLENLDEKTKTPPPVLTKKPLLGAKGILSGLKQKVKNVEKQLTSATSHDYADGIAASKMSSLCGGSDGVAGNVVMRRAATIAVENTDFDSVERTSILPDMRAGRVKAPRRRPPSAAYNPMGDSIHNNSNHNSGAYLNGCAAEAGNDVTHVEYVTKPPSSSDDNSTGDEQLLAKPRPREWQTQKAPWMEELKLSQVKKKTSPNVEQRSGSDAVTTNEDAKIASVSSVVTTTTTTTNTITTTTQKVQSTSTASSLQQPSAPVSESSQPPLHKSMLLPKNAPEAAEDGRMRPNSLSIRHRSTSPSTSASVTAAAGSRMSAKSAFATPQVASNQSTESAEVVSSSSNNNATHENNVAALAKHSQSVANASASATPRADGARLSQLEQRVDRLESLAHAQQRTIDELVRALREEDERVKVLRAELDKYAQCVTQV